MYNENSIERYFGYYNDRAYSPNREKERIDYQKVIIRDLSERPLGFEQERREKTYQY